MNIYVGNLNFRVNEEDLRHLFEEYGELSSVKIITDKYSGRSKGFGFVTMDNDKHAAIAIKELNGRKFDNREIVVNQSRT
jgi:RNA recognition motif-containing protein